MSGFVEIRKRVVAGAATRSAFSSAGQMLLFISPPLALQSLFDIYTYFGPWFTPIVVTFSAFAIEIGKTTIRLLRALRLSLYAFPPSILFAAVLPIFPVGTVGGSLLVAGATIAVTLLFEFTIFMANYRSDEMERWRRSTTAEKEVTSASLPGFKKSGESSVKLDARLNYRYQRARKEAEEEVRRFLPTNPRTAKRMVNHVSLAMAIAEERQLFDDPQITQQHLAKWIGVSEQWPELGAVLTNSPDHMYLLEEAADVAELQRILDNFAPGTLASEDMLQRLSDEHSLGGILPRLVRYEPH